MEDIFYGIVCELLRPHEMRKISRRARNDAKGRMFANLRARMKSHICGVPPVTKYCLVAGCNGSPCVSPFEAHTIYVMEPGRSYQAIVYSGAAVYCDHCTIMNIYKSLNI